MSRTGASLAILLGMKAGNRTSTGAITSFVRLIRAAAGASLAMVGFALAILLIGAPVALIVRAVHESATRLVRLRGDMSPLAEALVAVSSVVVAIVLVVAFVRLVAGFLEWRRRFHARA